MATKKVIWVECPDCGRKVKSVASNPDGTPRCVPHTLAHQGQRLSLCGNQETRRELGMSELPMG
jgi:hypothetical protein